jgi:hypothetical protein
MKSSDRAILLGLLILGVLAAFWFMLLAPKRERASELEQQVSTLQSEVTQQEQLAASAEEAQSDYDSNYERLIVLGKAAPADGDTPSLLTQLSTVASDAGADFDSLTATQSESVPAPAAAQTTTDQNAEAAEPTETESAPTAATGSTTAAPATEASASLLPLGASVGPAGLGVMPYTLQFNGDFFSMADVLAALDEQVSGKRELQVNGRLLTIDGFTMAPDEETGDLAVELSITSYVLPASQGLTAGATPAAPPTSVPAADSVPTSTPTVP